MKTKNIIQELVQLGIHSIPLIYLAIIWNQLPEEVPVHYNISGEADDWTSPRGLLYILIGYNYGLYLMFLFIPKLAAKKFLKSRPQVWIKLRFGLTIFLSAIGFLMVYMAVGDVKVGILCLGILFAILSIFLGNYLQVVKPNYLVGIRTPWTLESENVWRKTHQVGGKIMFWGGVISLPVIFLLPMEYAPIPSVTALVSSALFSLIYSYILFKKEKSSMTNS